MSVPLEDLPSHVPTSPAIYALHGGTAGNRRVAYVGQARNLRIRLRQHLLLRDSSITTGAAVVSLNPDLVRAVDWWTHDGFSDSVTLEAAELVAFDVLDPTLRSQGWPSLPARELSSKTQFIESFRKLFLSAPIGEGIRQFECPVLGYPVARSSPAGVRCSPASTASDSATEERKSIDSGRSISRTAMAANLRWI